MKRILIFISLMILSHGVYADFNRNLYYEQGSNLLFSTEQQYRPKKSSGINFGESLDKDWGFRGAKSQGIFSNGNSYYKYAPKQEVRPTVPSFSSHRISKKGWLSDKMEAVPFAGDEVITRGPAEGGGAPPTDFPVGDALIPMLLFMSLYIVIKKKRVG